MVLSNAVSAKAYVSDLVFKLGSDEDQTASFIYLRSEEDELETHLSTVATFCLSALSSFLEEFQALASTQPPESAEMYKIMLGSPYFMTILKKVLSLHRGAARLAALRVILTLVLWEGFIEKLVEGDISEGLVMIASEASHDLREQEQQEQQFYSGFYSPQRSGSLGASGSGVFSGSGEKGRSVLDSKFMKN